MEKLVVRSGLGFVIALASLPCIALAQPVEPAPAAAPPAAPVEPLPEPAPAPAEPTMAPISPEPAPAVVAAPTPAEAPAEEEAPAPLPTISGYVEAAYHIALLDPRADYAVPMHGFYDPTGNSFLLHAAHLAVNHSFTDNVSATIEIDAGYDAMLNGTLDKWWGDADSSSIPFDIQEAYATYKSGVFSVTAGKFVTYQGIEIVEGPLNPTITRGFLFGFAEPVTHTGVKLHFTGETYDIGIGVVNGWDKLLDNNDWKTIIFKIGLTPSEAFTVSFNGTFGAEGDTTDDGHRLSLDLTGAWTASESFALWFQANYGMDALGAEEGESVSWYGFGLQPTYTTEMFTFGGRVELFSDPDGARTGAMDTTFVNVTLVPGFILAQGFKVRVELRADIATEELLGKEDDLGKFQLTAALGAEYVF